MAVISMYPEQTDIEKRARVMVDELNAAIDRMNGYIENSGKPAEEWEVEPESMESVAFVQLYDMARAYLAQEANDENTLYFLVAFEMFKMARENREKLHPGSVNHLPVVD